MGMFDYYEPVPAIHCVACETPLRNWQGKDGPCALFAWRQGVREPIYQQGYPECQISVAMRNEFRLPKSFLIYSDDCEKHRLIYAWCEVSNEIWHSCELLPYKDLEPEQYARFIEDLVRVKRLRDKTDE
jgi:hypothetical protein